MQLFICLKCSQKRKRSCFNLSLTSKNVYVFFTNLLWNTKKIKRIHFNLWRQNACTRSLKMFCKIPRSNLTKEITLFIFDVKNVCIYSSNIKLSRYKIYFSLLTNYSIKTAPHVCVKTFFWLSSCCVYFL